MTTESTLERIEFNEITQAGIFAQQVGLLLEDRLGKMMIEVDNYWPTSTTITVGEVFSVDVTLTDVSDDTTLNSVITYTVLAGDGVIEVLEGLAQWVVDNPIDVDTPLNFIANTFTDFNTDAQMYMVFVPREGYTLSENSKTLLSSDPKKVWADSDTPASYVAYGTHPTSSLPRVIITPLVQNTISDRFEESVILIDDVETEYTSSYIDYSFNITCEAGAASDVLKTGVSAQSILNHLKKAMVNERVKKLMQNSLNSVYHPITTITSAPLVEYTQFMDMASTNSVWSTIDVYYPDVESGFMEAVHILAGDPDTEEGVLYKYSNSEDEETVIYGDALEIDRRNV